MGTERRAHEAELEKELIARFRAGDQAAFGRLFELYRRPMYRLCLQHLGDPTLAEDAVQEAFFRALRALPRFDARRRFFPWLAAIASNCAYDLRRSGNRTQAVDPDEAYPEQQAAGDVAMIAIDRVRIRQALSRLPDVQRRMLLLHDLQGLSCEEVAEREGKTELAVRSALFRARSTMRAFLRALGIAGVTIRLLQRRVQQRIRQLGLPSEILVAVTPAAIAAATAAAIFALGTIESKMSPAANEPPESAIALPAVVIASKPLPVLQRRNHFVRGFEQTGHDDFQGEAGPFSWRASGNGRRSGSIAPSGGRLTIEVIGPDGDILYYNETWIECAEVGTLPDVLTSGPVRALC